MKNPTSKTTTEHARTAQPEASCDPKREALYLCLASIPPGYVVSYGQIAELAGVPRGARWAARTLSQLPEGSRLPWHRVTTTSGRPGLSQDCPAGEEQRKRLNEEGIFLIQDRVNMRRHRWHPPLQSG